MQKLTTFFFVISLISLFLGSASALELTQINESKWTRCASEGSTCSFEGRRIVRFGRDDAWKYLETDEQIKCVSSAFGDPAPFKAKYCEFGSRALQRSAIDAPSILRLNVFVFDDEHLLNSKRWTRTYINSVLSAASELLDNSVKFEIDAYKIIVDEKLYSDNRQSKLMDEFISKNHKYGRLSVGLSGPRSIDTAGMAIQNSFVSDLKPKIVLRSRLNDGSKEDIIEVARIFLHEIGHTLGFSHDGSLEKMPYNTDDWWFLAGARKFFSQLVNWTVHADESRSNAISKFECKVGGFEPDTNLFENLRTQAFDLNECAHRCLVTENCVSIAQGQWSYASCLIFTKGAQIIKKRQYGNANTCWLKGEGP